MNLSNLKIGVRLACAFGGLLVLLCMVGVTGLLKLGDVRQAGDNVIHKDMVKLELVSHIGRNVRANATRAIELMIARTGEDAAASRKVMTENIRKIDDLMSKLEPLLYAPEGKAGFAAIKEARTAYRQAFEALAKAVESGETKKAQELYFTAVRPRLDILNQKVTAFEELQVKLAESNGKAAAQAYESGRAFVIGLSAAAILIGLLFAWPITRSITVPINEAVSVAQRVAAGDLTSTVEVKTKDETGLLLQALKDMNVSLAKIVGEVRGGTDSISTATKQIASGNADLSQRTEEQASSLEETASSMEELTSTVKQNAENARQANQLAVGASDVAVKGGDVVKQVVTTMSGISESSKKIADIIGTIDGIAFQTNILALNAAVEAARAGEQGRGFAVVATEVRNLAQRSAAAAKEIKELITDSVSRVDTGTQLVDKAGRTMDEIVGSVKRVTDIMAEISAASQEQSSGIEQVNQAITQMDEVTQQNAALVEEAAAAAESMEEQARSLQQAVAVFKLSAGTPVPRAAASVIVTETRPAAKNVAKFERKARATPAAANEGPRAKKVAGAEDDWKEF